MDWRRGGEEHAVSSLSGRDSTVQIVVRETYSLTMWSVVCQGLLDELLLQVFNSHQSGRECEQVQEFLRQSIEMCTSRIQEEMIVRGYLKRGHEIRV